MANPRGAPQNLRPFQKGVSGNAGGRPKLKPITDAYRRMAMMPMPEELLEKINRAAGSKLESGSTYAEGLAVAQFAKAIAGEAVNARELREAIEGRANQRIELVSDEFDAATDIGPADGGASEAYDQLLDIYGLRDRVIPTTAQPFDPVPVSESVDQGSSTAEDRRKE